MKLNKIEITAVETHPKTPFPDPLQPAANRGRTAQPVTPAELATWVQKAKDLPDIRWDKVHAMRAAIREAGFDLDPRLANFCDRHPDELIEYLRRLGEP